MDNTTKRKRNVFLFGAGAAMDWGGPKTICNGKTLTSTDNKPCCLTHLIRERGPKCKSGETISNKIYQTLISKGFKNINFETIINVIEELIIYYSNFNNEPTSSLLSCFLSPTEIMLDILNFEVEGGIVKHGYKLIIPDNLHIDKISLNNETPEQFFLQLSLIELLTPITAQVSHYAYYTKGNPKVIENTSNKCLNDHFYNWIKTIIDKDEIIRMYTLNYERLFKVILENRGIRIFEGFECGASLNPGDSLSPDVKRIYTDFDSHAHYNLHGSVFWHISTRSYNQLPISEFQLTSIPNISSNLWEQPTRQIDKGKTIILTNIITGYQKTSKVAITPFKQMQSAFDRDCLFADRLYIIGYSFEDEHINESIKTTLRYNPDTEIIIFEPNFFKNGIESKLAIEIFPNSSFGLSPQNIETNLVGFLGNRVKVHIKYFKDILQN